MYLYTWYQWLAFFYFYSFFGWIFESCYVSCLKKRFVNRGFLRIPLLPLYGSGAIMMLWFSRPFQDNLLLTFVSGMAGATALEYATGYVMERLFKIRYWDYSDKRCNLNGYICLESTVAWGFLTILMTHAVHRPVAQAVLSISPATNIAVISVVSCIFIYDSVVSVREAFALGRTLEALTRLRRDLEGLQVQAALLKMEAREKISEAGVEMRERRTERLEERREELRRKFESLTGFRLEELREKAELALNLEDLLELKDLAELHLDSWRGKTERQLEELRAEKENRIAAARAHHTARRRAMLRSNPSAASSKFGGALKELKAFLEE